MTQSFRTRRALALLLVLVALAALVPRVLTHVPYARLGVSLDYSADDSAPRVARVIGPPAEGLLKVGDRLISVDGVGFNNPALRPTVKRSGLPRDPFVLRVERGDFRFDVTVPPVRLSPWQRIRILLLPLGAVVAAPLVAFALVWRRPDLPTAWAFLWFAGLQAAGTVHEIYRFPEFEAAGGLKTYLMIYAAWVCWLPASFVHFMSVFPRPHWGPEGRGTRFWIASVVLAYGASAYLTWRVVMTGALPEPAASTINAAASLLGAVILVVRYGLPGRGEWQPTRSQRVLALMVAALVAASLLFSTAFDSEFVAALMQATPVRLLLPLIGVGMLLTPFVLAYLIALDPVFDPRRILQRGLPYALLTGLLAGLYLAVVLTGERLFAAVTGQEAVVVNVAAALIVAFLFAPLRERVQTWLDRLFRRDPRMLRVALDRAGRELLRALDPAELRTTVESGLARGLGRPVSLAWPERGTPELSGGEELPEDARVAVDNLLNQAGIRLENLALAEERAAAERRAAELREAATRAELRALHAQVQPHFLFNALNALSYLIETDPPAAQRFTERLADMLRYTVEAGDRSHALLGDEIGFVEDYLGVARERYEGDLRFEYRGPRELLSASVPPLLLQPLVENSLKHGLGAEARPMALTLDACREDGWLTLEFADDGSNGNGNVPGLGVGLHNLMQRMRRFAGPTAEVVAGPRNGGGFTVRLRWQESAAAVDAARNSREEDVQP